MALMLAPYNSAMRLGMGFNSYTQSLCVNDVVRKPGNMLATEDDLRAARLTEKPATAGAQPRQIAVGAETRSPENVLDGASGSVSRTFRDGQKEVSQVVSWDARFIENSSDVLKSLNISGALSITLDGLGSVSGKAAFVDSSDIKTADINYVIHVRVVNQRLIADNITQFSPIENVDPGQFTEIYGDCFISGFIEGGEFDAIVSVTTADTLKKNSLSGGLEADAKIAMVSVKGKVEGGKEDTSTDKKAQTNIKVTWSGGGDIRNDSIKEWSLENLKQVAMEFPDAVAACPQRVSAILTKYSSLRSFHEESKKGSPLDYENAGIYTASLYDAYTDYKLMWKEIQTMISLVNKREIELYMREASPRLVDFAKGNAERQTQKLKQYQEAVNTQKEADSLSMVPYSSRLEARKSIEKPLPANSIDLYHPDIFGLEDATRDCRFEMIKIVREVNAVTKDPKVASDPTRTSMYLSPSVFRLLLPTPQKERLPTYKEWTDTNASLAAKKEEVINRDREISEIKKKLEAALITPMTNDKGTLMDSSAEDLAKLHPSIQDSLSKLAYRADGYRMQSLLEDKSSISTGAAFFNDLESLELDARPTELRVWCDDKKIKGLSVVYPNKTVTHGVTDDNPKHVIKLAHDEVITEIEFHVTKGEEEKLSVTSLAAATSKCNILTAGTKSGGKTYSYSMADHLPWSFRGFMGFFFVDGFEDFGVVWGKDVVSAATSTVQAPPAKNLLGMSSSLQEKTKKAMSVSKPAQHFYLGDCVSVGSSASQANSFSALDTISGASKIRKIAFSISTGRLSGLKVDYNDGKQLIHGAYTPDQETWASEIKSPIIAAKITVAKTGTKPEPFVDTVELVCGEDDGGLPLWPLDVSTVRYLGAHVEEKPDVVSKLVEQAPKLARANWTLRGFYGEEGGGIITRLGFVWGCA